MEEDGDDIFFFNSFSTAVNSVIMGLFLLFLFGKTVTGLYNGQCSVDL